MPTRKSFPGRVNERRKKVLKYWEDRLKQPVETLIVNAKRFKGVVPSEKELNSYKTFIKKQIETLKQRITG